MKHFEPIEMPFFQDIFGNTPLDYALSIEKDESFYKSKLSIFAPPKIEKDEKKLLEDADYYKLKINQCIYNALNFEDTSKLWYFS